jgi:hypothetical protein
MVTYGLDANALKKFPVINRTLLSVSRISLHSGRLGNTNSWFLASRWVKEKMNKRVGAEIGNTKTTFRWNLLPHLKGRIMDMEAELYS